MESLLEGSRVLDLTDEKGLYCGRILADLGGEAIMVEPVGGSKARRIGPFYKDMVHPEKSLFWFYTCLNKRGITLNIETEEGKDIFRRLAQKADFIIESFEPGYMNSLQLGYSDLAKINKRLIMISITPFGQTGPYAHYKMTDIGLQGMGGVVYMHGEPDRPPVRLGGEPQAFFMGGLHGALGSVMAYYYREISGEGQYVDVSIQEAVELHSLTLPEFWDAMKVNAQRAGRARAIYRAGKPMLPQRVVYECRDGYFHFFIGGGAQVGRGANSKAMVNLANDRGMLTELKDYDWRLYDASSISVEDNKRIEDLIESFTRTLDKKELLEESLKRGMILSPIYTPCEFMERPQQKARDFWVMVEHPELGDAITYAGAPVNLSECPWKVYRRAPLIGEHNEEIYVDELGFSKEDLVILKSEGIV